MFKVTIRQILQYACIYEYGVCRNIVTKILCILIVKNWETLNNTDMLRNL